MRAAPTLFAQFKALFKSGDSWFDADRVLIDGGSGKVSTWIDYIDPTHTLVQTTSANQCAVAADALLRGRKSLQFVGGQRYDSSRAASAWSYLHQAGHTAVWVGVGSSVTTTRYMWSTQASAVTSSIGASLLHVAAELRVRVGAGSGVTPVSLNVASTLPASPAGLGSITRMRSDATWDVRFGGATIGSGTATGLGAGSPGITLRVGAVGGSGGFFSGNTRALYFFRRALSTYEQAVFTAFVRADCGVAV